MVSVYSEKSKPRVFICLLIILSSLFFGFNNANAAFCTNWVDPNCTLVDKAHALDNTIKNSNILDPLRHLLKLGVLLVGVPIAEGVDGLSEIFSEQRSAPKHTESKNLQNSTKAAPPLKKTTVIKEVASRGARQ